MATGPRFAVKFRRSREGKTNYTKRRVRIQSDIPRLVARKSDRYVFAQIISFNLKGDKTLVQASTKELAKTFGWKENTKNLPAAYLAGLLIGKRAVDAKIKEAAFDIGANPSIKGSRLYALLKGAVDAGLKIPHDAKVLPSADRISGKHINENIQKEVESIKKKVLGK